MAEEEDEEEKEGGLSVIRDRFYLNKALMNKYVYVYVYDLILCNQVGQMGIFTLEMENFVSQGPYQLL